MSRHVGGSILPSEGPDTLKPQAWNKGTLQVVFVEQLDTYTLMLFRDFEGREVSGLIAAHPNGHSCKELANRIMAVWQWGGSDEAAGVGRTRRALAQFDFILDCGGFGIKRSGMVYWLSAEGKASLS